MKFDKYGRIARIYPALICLLPILLFFNFSNNEVIIELTSKLGVKIVSNISLVAVLTYLFAMICRGISKEMEREFFKNELEFPTTNYLLGSDSTFSTEYKHKIIEKAEKEFGMRFPSDEEQTNNEPQARKQIAEIVGQIRNKVRDGNLLLQHNIEYGFVRNLIGGSFLSVLLSLLLLAYYILQQANIGLIIVSGILALFYFSLILLRTILLKRYSELYAKRLYMEFLN